MAEEKKSHWQFLASLLGAETAHKEEAEVVEQPRKAVVEGPAPPLPSKRKPLGTKPTSRPAGWNDLAEELGLEAEDGPDQFDEPAQSPEPSIAEVTAETTPLAAAATNEPMLPLDSELPPTLPGFGVRARKVVEPPPASTVRDPEPDSGRSPSRAWAPTEKFDDDEIFEAEKTDFDEVVEIAEDELGVETFTDTVGSRPDDDDDVKRRPRRRRRRRRRSAREDDKPASRDAVVAEVEATLDDELAFDDVELEDPGEVEIRGEVEDREEAEERRPRRRRRKRRSSRDRDDQASEEFKKAERRAPSDAYEVVDIDEVDIDLDLDLDVDVDVDVDVEDEDDKEDDVHRYEVDRRPPPRAVPAERILDEDEDEDDSEVEPRRRGQFTSWPDAINHVIAANLAKRTKTNGRGGSGGSGRRGRDGGRGRGRRGSSGGSQSR